MNKPKLLLSGSLIVLLFTLLISCDKKVGNLPVPEPPPSVDACDTITYTQHIKKIMDNNCVSCHGPSIQQGGVTLNTLAAVKIKATEGRIKARAIDGIPSFMPQGGELTAAEKDLITCWLNNGMKE